MRIGELAERAGTTTRALRFYESQGLLSARRASNGYRDYDESDFRMLREILSLQAIGLSLEETKPFVECLRSGHDRGDSCTDSIAMYRRKLAELDAGLERLHRLRDDLAVKLSAATAARDAGPGVPCQFFGNPHPVKEQ